MGRGGQGFRPLPTYEYGPKPNPTSREIARRLANRDSQGSWDCWSEREGHDFVSLVSFEEVFQCQRQFPGIVLEKEGMFADAAHFLNRITARQTDIHKRCLGFGPFTNFSRQNIDPSSRLESAT